VEVERKGVYFSFDALIAASLLFTTLFLVYSLSGPSGIETESSSFQRADSVAEDAVQMLMRSDMEQTYSTARRSELVNSTPLTEEDMNGTVMESIAVLWASNRTGEARNLTKEFFGNLLPEAYDYRLRVFNENASVIYNTSDDIESSDVIARATRLVSGVSRNQPTQGFTATASLSSLEAVKSEYFYFGGYVGDGNVTVNVTLPDLDTVQNVSLEGDIAGPFDLSFNDADVGHYQPTVGNLSADVFSICSTEQNASNCAQLQPGDNHIRFNFTTENRSIGGGFLQITYNRTTSLEEGGTTYLNKRHKLPGIDGIINLYSGVNVPGTLHGINGRLHYEAQNRTLFMRLGNATIYEERIDGETTVALDNASIHDNVTAMNMSYGQMSRSTVPLRVGLKGLDKVRGRAIADSASVIDVSGSMDDGLLEEAKNASKRFTEIILNASGNRAGMVSYESVIDDVHPLTTNETSLKDAIDDLTAGGGTCIGCGILETIDVVTEPKVDTLIEKQERWQYNTSYPDSSPPLQDGTNWTQTGYNHSIWENGTAILGYGTTVNTTVPDTGGDTYFRNYFSYDPSKWTEVTAAVRSDDAAALYVNGRLVDNDTGTHDGRYWNRITGEVDLQQPVSPFVDSFERSNVEENWTVPTGSEGNEVDINNECGASEGSEAVTMRWDTSALETTLSLPDDEYVSEVAYDVRQGNDDGPNGDCENPESGEDLQVEYYTEDGEWQTLKTHPGGGSDPSGGSWAAYGFDVPRDGVHDGFKLRFYYTQGSGSDYDYWGIDNVTLTLESGEPVAAINESMLRDGQNVVAVKLKNDGATEQQHWITDTASDWNEGSFTNTTVNANDRLELAGTADTDDFDDNSIGGSWTTTDQDGTSGTSFEETGGELQITANGEDIWKNADEYGAVFQDDVDGDWNTSVTVTSQDDTHNWAKSGIMARNDVTDAGNAAGYVAMVATQGNGWSMQRDTDDDGHLDTSTTTGSFSFPTTVRLEKSGTTFTGYYSTDGGSTWNEVDSVTMSSANTVQDVGMIHSSHNQGTLGTAAFDDWSLGSGEYERSGKYTSKVFDAGTVVPWNTSNVTNTTPVGTSVNISYSNTTHWFDTITAVPDSRYLQYNLSLDTNDTGTSPAVDTVNVSYLSSTAEFDVQLNATQNRKRSMVVMSDGVANEDTDMTDVPDHNNDSTVDAKDHTIEAGCRAQDNNNITVYAVGFGDGADNETLNLTAQCGDGEYYFSSTGELEAIFANISNTILNASFVGQTIETEDETAQGRLYSDSFLDLNYTENTTDTAFGTFSLQQSSDRFGGNVTSPKNGSFTVPSGVTVTDAKVTSYSANYWADRLRIENSSSLFEPVYQLWQYDDEYTRIGDPYLLQLPVAKVQSGTNGVQVDTGLDENDTQGGSPDNRVLYTVEVEGTVGYDDVYIKSEGGNYTFSTIDGPVTIQVGNSSDTWNASNDAVDDATERLVDKLDVDNDGTADFKLSGDDLNIETQNAGGLQWLWGPARVSMEVWR
jgi:hypothetical protein